MNKYTLQICRVGISICQIRTRSNLLLLSVALALVHFQSSAAQPDSILISMNLKKAPLEKAFILIKQQSPYRVIYDNDILKKAKLVTLIVRKASISQVLELLLQNQPFDYRIVDQTIIVTPRHTNSNDSSPEKTVSMPGSTSIRDTTITGIVIADSTLVPLAGATITIKGTNTYTMTDNNGRFRLVMPATGRGIVISYIGYQSKQIPLNSIKGNPATIILNKISLEMQEVTIVNTGYQTLPKERATGSFAQVDNATLNQQIGSNILNRLDGITSGVLFQKQNLLGAPSFMVRGLSSINGPKDPLIVLDNFPYDGDINNINPNDVDNVTILKDAAAASIWGTRAGNGVVVITTKKGRLNQPLKIDLNANYTFTGMPDLSYLRTISSSDYIDVEKTLFNNGYYDSYLGDTYNYPALSPVIEILNNQRSYYSFRSKCSNQWLSK
jgi:TonB-dependent SusC/RagA subfamily outer membrane receptor